MSVLDDPGAMSAADPSDMLGAVSALPSHAEAAYAATETLTAADLPAADGIHAIAFLGMGGSAVAGDIARALFSGRLGLSLETVRSPELPAHVQQHALVIATSYSGNTAETLAAFEEAVERGCRIIAITSGGTLSARAAEEGIPVVSVPGGLQPRAALGYLSFTTIGVLETIGVIPTQRGDVAEAIRVIREVVSGCSPSVRENAAMTLAQRIGERIPVIWGTDGLGSTAAMRWKTQFNENAKTPAWYSTMSELDHNEVVGWFGEFGRSHVVITLRHGFEDERIAPRFALTQELAAACGLGFELVQARGVSALAQLLSLIVVGDFASVYAGILRGVDPTPVSVIDRLKEALG